MDEQRPTFPEEPPAAPGGMPALLLAAGVATLVALTVATFVWAARGSTDDEEEAGLVDPRIGSHWHANYAIYIGEERQPNMPTWESGVHTHGDGIIHIHPFQSFEEGSGASLGKFFEYGGGLLTDDEIRIPGASQTFRNGDQVPVDGGLGEVLIAARSAIGPERLEDLGNGWYRVSPEYIPRDGDQIISLFSTEREVADLLARTDGVPTLTPVPLPQATVTF